jgi:mono/diheme cytochrome c family protein
MLIARLTSWLMLVGLLLVGLALPASADDHTLAAKGKYLAQAGDCIACHTDPGAPLFAGGRAMATPFGTI